jgi:hypothetical protein
MNGQVKGIRPKLDIRHSARKLVAEISLKTKKNKKKFPGALFFDFSSAVAKTALCLFQEG